MASKKPNQNEGGLQLGAGCLALFALPFAGFGLMVAWWYVSAISTWLDAQQWDETTAVIESVDLKVKRDSDSTSYRVVASYEYTYKGRRLHGDRVGVFTGSDNIGRYHHRMHSRLQEAMRRERPTPCYVDPDNPERALLDRSMRLGMLAMYTPFATLFTGVGVGLLAYGLPMAGRERAALRLAKLHPDEPWRQRPAWQGESIAHNNAAKAWGLTAAAAWALAFTLPSAWIAWQVDDGGTAPRIVIAAMTAIALAVAGVAAFEQWRTLRYGTSRLRLATMPGVIGGKLTGVAVIPTQVKPAEGFRVRLLCQEKRNVKRSGKSQTKTITLWQDERLVLHTLDTGEPRSTAVPVDFTIPSDAHATELTGRTKLTWRLLISAKAAGPDYRAEWETPVFLTEDSRDGVIAELPTAHAPDTPQPEVPLAKLARHDGIRVQESVGRLEVGVPPLRGGKLALPLMVFGLITAGSAYWLYTEAQWIFVVVFSPIAAICILSAVGVLLGSSRLTISGDDWTARSGWYGLRRARRMRVGDIKAIRLRTSFRASSDNGETYHTQHVLADLRSGGKATLVTGVRNPRLADLLRAELTRRAGLEQPVRDQRPLDSSGWTDALDLPADDHAS
ncbi:hypothetical protein KOR34_47370 [Posidoniimonas corsicana]|uniref:DUF3592 domain-containing protein n=1 Tax=Posidoniimonas corsicana TaxID=1938618 RepID=A0A5C5UWD1_9BACT|nr:DUF3592 domain-containing protein [Posidoniimonas corsicana]TWT30179.1 hypothetical protein KOR34_47370 [Posidoniimonas corsicana]